MAKNGATVIRFSNGIASDKMPAPSLREGAAFRIFTVVMAVAFDVRCGARYLRDGE